MSESIQTTLPKHLAGDARFDDATRLIYSTDASNYKVKPLGVVLPKTHDDVLVTVQLCAEHGVPIVPRGGGSGLAGQSIGPGIVLDFTRYMDSLLDLDVSSSQVRVQPGMILGQLNKKLACHGLLFGPDPASAERAAIGGIIGTNATGAHSIRYGMTADNVSGLQAVLADGRVLQVAAGQVESATSRELSAGLCEIVDCVRPEIYSAYPRVWRRSSGYNLDYIAEMMAYDAAQPMACLTQPQAARRGANLENHLRQVSRFHLSPLIAGSEGTLAILTEATLQLHPKPGHTALVIVSFQELIASMRAIPALLSLNPSAIELIGGLFIKLARDLPECRDRLAWLPAHERIPNGLLVIEFDADSDAELHEVLTRLNQLVAREHLPCTVAPLLDARQQADVWYVRKIGLNVLASLRSDFKPISLIEDVAVPVEALPEYVTRLSAIFAEHGTEGAFYAHASAGVLHVRPLVNVRTHNGLDQMQRIGRATFALCRELSGAMSGEHGDGYERSHWNRALFGESLYQAFVDVKRLFDPKGLLNPNKKVDALHEAQLVPLLRLGPDHHARTLESAFAFARDGSMANLSAECNGSGVCRKLEGGVMCPSYRATREEMHSTRGRANLLREMLFRLQAAAQAPQAGPAPAEMVGVHAALDLCLSCKACASECASGVDMAKLKSTFLQQIYEKRGVPLRAWLFGRIALLSRLAAPVAPLANWLLARGALKRALGIAPDRQLPRFARPRRITARAPLHDTQVTVALFLDTFTRYNHPELALDAIAVLETCGYTVLLPEIGCCGRPLISQGQPRAAQQQARALLAQLAPLAARGIPILTLEPSCQSALLDDYGDLLPGAETQTLARSVKSIEDFLAGSERYAAYCKRLPPQVQAEVLLHGHCHQKALWGTAGTRRMLSLAGLRVREIESTCCGMAGAFGYEAEHVALSRQIAGLDLLPAVQAVPDETQICAPGTSCREQIAGLSTRSAQHPVRLVWAAMASSASP